MRIGIDVRCLAEGKRTGVEEYTISLLEKLLETDTENEYILFFNAWRKKVPDFSWATQYPNVTLRAFHFPNKLFNLMIWYLGWPKLDTLIGGTDIFFLPNLNFTSVSRKTKLVVTAHDLSFEMFPETFSWRQRLWHFLVNFRGLLRRADRIIAVSQSTCSDLISYYGVPEKKVSVVQSGISDDFHSVSRNHEDLLRVQEKYKLPYKFILALSTLEPRKNILSLVEAFEALQRLDHPVYGKYSLVLAGTRGWKCEELFEAVEKSPFRDRIILAGYITDSEKAALYNLASVFVYPSFYEGFGFPPLEAMACGTPVIASHSSSLPEVVGSAGILIDPYQPDELFRALQEVLLQPGLCETLSKKGLIQAKKFTWEKTAKETLDILHRL